MYVDLMYNNKIKNKMKLLLLSIDATVLKFSHCNFFFTALPVSSSLSTISKLL